MKKNYRILLPSLMFFTAFSLSAEETLPSSESEQLLLPEVTTSVSGDSIETSKDALPDFSTILPDTEKMENILPLLPGVELDTGSDEYEADLGYEEDKSLFVRGYLGGGYPRLFSGDFSLDKSSGNNPFKIQFSHFSASGYGEKSVSEGYFDGKTLLYGEKTFSSENLKAEIFADYETLNTGFQQKSPVFFDTTSQGLSTGGNILWKLPYGFSISGNAFGEWYSRYGGIKDSSAALHSSIDDDAETLILSPEIIFSWAYSGFYADITSSYTYETFIGSANLADSASGGSFIHRGDFALDLGWKNKNLDFKGNVGAVVGNKIGEARALVPFDLSFKGNWELGSDGRNLLVEVKGGLDSYLSGYSELEKNYLFVSQNYLPGESSDWFAELYAGLPIVSDFNLDLSASFAKTAFGNGVWEADYSAPDPSGLYELKQYERTAFDSDIELSYRYKLAVFSAGWISHWIHVPSTESPFLVKLRIDLQAENGKWGGSLEGRECISSGDYVPFLDASAFYRFRENLSIELDIEDAVKIFSGANRNYASSIYAQRGGSASLKFKFSF